MMPAMTTVLHLYDHRTPSAALPALMAVRRRQSGCLTARIGGRTRPDLPVADHVLRRPWGWSLTAAPEIRRLAEARHVGAIHCWSPAVAEAAAAIGRPTVLSVFRPPSARDARALKAAAMAGAHVTTPSATLADLVVRAGVPREQVHVIMPAAAPIQWTPAERAAARRNIGVGAHTCVMITPPQDAADRGPYRSVWALGILCRAGFDAHLIVPGRHRQIHSVRRFAVDIEMERRVHFPGPTDSDAPCRVWPAVDLALLYDDGGFGLPAAAIAVAAGVPIIAANAGELAAHLRDSATALLVPPRTPRLLSRAMWRLGDNPDFATALTNQTAAELAELTDVDRMLGRFDELYAKPNAAAPLTKRQTQER